MADAVDDTKALAERLAEIVKAISGEGGESDDEGGGDKTDVAPPEVSSGFTPASVAAAKSFRSTIRWMLAAFGAVAFVVFGSIPFANVTGDGRNPWLIFIGLLLAALGLAAAIWAVSRVLEPEDASLGELEKALGAFVTPRADLDEAIDACVAATQAELEARAELKKLGPKVAQPDGEGAETPRPRPGPEPSDAEVVPAFAPPDPEAQGRHAAELKVERASEEAAQAFADVRSSAPRYAEPEFFWPPPKKSLFRLNEILTGADGHSHFGPDWHGDKVAGRTAAARVGDLIGTLGTGDRERFKEAATVAKLQTEFADAQASLKARSEELDAAVERYVKMAEPSKEGAAGTGTPAPDRTAAPAVPLDDLDTPVTQSQQKDHSRTPEDRANGARTAGKSAQDAGTAALWAGVTDGLDELKKARQCVLDAETDLREKRGALAEIDAKVAVHLARRDLLINESAVSQIQGSFRLARWVLLVGVLATASGTALYALGLPGDDANGDDTATAPQSIMRRTPGVEAPEDAVTFELTIVGAQGDLAGCSDPAAERPLTGTLVSLGEPSVVIVTAPQECAGEWVLPSGSWSGDVPSTDTPEPTQPKEEE